MPEVDPLYSVTRAAELLDVSRDTVYRLINRRVLPVVELGNGRAKQRIPAKALAEFIEKRTHPAI